MAHTWLSDWDLVTCDLDPIEDADKMAALGRLFHAANYDGRLRGARGESVKSVPQYVVPKFPENSTGGGE